MGDGTDGAGSGALVAWWRDARTRAAGVAIAVTLVATVLGTARQPDEAAATQVGRSFPLTVRTDLAHVADEELVVSLGTEEAEASPARPTGDAGETVELAGAAGVSGLVQVTDTEGHLAGVAVAPKDDELFGEGDGDAAGERGVTVDYRSTAFGLFAIQPGLASTEPAVTLLLAALVVDLPELDRLTDTLASAARRDPGYLDDLPPDVVQALGDLLAAFDAHVTDLDAQITGGTGESGNPGGSVPTTRLRAPRSTAAADPDVSDPDGCGDDPVPDVEVLDDDRQDHVCFTGATFRDGAWEVEGRSNTPRWAIARAVDDGIPVGSFQLIPGRSLSLPSVGKLVIDVLKTRSEILSAAEQQACHWIHICDAPDWSSVLRKVLHRVQSYLGETDFAFRLDESAPHTVLAVNGPGEDGGDAPSADITTSTVITLIMVVVVPVAGMFLDVKDLLTTAGSLGQETVQALADLGLDLADDVAEFFEEIQTGSLVDKLGTTIDLLKAIIHAVFDSDLLPRLLADLAQGKALAAATPTATDAAADTGTAAEAGAAAVPAAEGAGGAESIAVTGELGLGAAELGAEVAELATPLAWIDAGIAVTNVGVTLAMLLDDLPELATSARYQLGGPDEGRGGSPTSGPVDLSGVVPNPPLPDDSCGLRVALVLDRSGSIRHAGPDAMRDVREAAVGLVDALGSTPSSVRISAFGTWVTTQLDWTSLADATGRRAARQSASTVEFAATDAPDAGTNWEAALTDVQSQDADLVVLVTDGDPTVFGTGTEASGSDAKNPDYDSRALPAGIDAANELKRDGTRVVAVGVGDVHPENLEKVSGEARDSDYFVPADDEQSDDEQSDEEQPGDGRPDEPQPGDEQPVGGELASLGPLLAEQATTLCGAALVIRHRVGGVPTAGAIYSADVGDGDEDQPLLVTAADGLARLSRREGGGEVTVGLPAGGPLRDVSCDADGAPLDDDDTILDPVARTLTVPLDGIVTCTFDWLALSGSELTMAGVIQGPGRVEAVSFAPDPGAGGVVIGCLGRPAPAGPAGGDGPPAATCDIARFGLDPAGGFAVIRYDDRCAGCPPADRLEVRRDRDGVHFLLDRAPEGGLDPPTTDLALTVASSEARAGRVSLAGRVVGDLDLDIRLVRPPDPAACLAHRSGRGAGRLVPGTAHVTTGSGC